MIEKARNKKAATLMKKRVIAICVTLALVAVLLIAYFCVNSLAKPTLAFDDTDGTRYFIMYRGGEYSMYTTDGEPLKRDEQLGYFVTEAGSLVDIDSETGASREQVVVDELIEGETSQTVTATDVRVLMFPHVEEKGILKLEVVNEHGKYTLVRIDDEGQESPSGKLMLKEAPTIQFDPESFPMIYTAAGYTISTQKVKDPIVDENGEYSEYGLVAETRIDDEGNEYEYTPAYYILTETNGKKHKVILGDRLVSANGYYAQYVNIDENGNETKRAAVYVLNPTTAVSLYSPLEKFVYPMLTYPMSINNYFDVENFSLAKKDGDAYNEIVNFTYIDLAERENTIKALFPYVFANDLGGYRPSSESIDFCLQSLYEPEVSEVIKIVKDDRNYYRTLAEYGFYTAVKNENGESDYEISSDYIISYDYDIIDDEGKLVDKINNMLLICGPNEDGDYYAYTIISKVTERAGERRLEFLYAYDQVLLLDGDKFSFLEYDRYKWISRSYFELNIAYCEKIELISPDYSAIIDVDNSASDSSESTKSDRISVIATDSLGNSKNTFGGLAFKDANGYDWQITSTNVAVYLDGKIMSTSSSYYSHNSLGQQVMCLKGYIPAADGRHIYVYEDSVLVNFPDGHSEEYVRYDTEIFRKYFQTYLYATIVDSYEMSDEDEAELLNDPTKLLLTLRLTDTEGTVTEYKFYSLTARKAYITVNGNGGFYVTPGRVQKFITDTQKFFNNEPINPTAKS
jgi:hypothetical protein